MLNVHEAVFGGEKVSWDDNSYASDEVAVKIQKKPGNFYLKHKFHRFVHWAVIQNVVDGNAGPLKDCPFSVDIFNLKMFLPKYLL